MSSYNPRKQGYKDAQQGKERRQHQSAYNQRIYNEGYDEAVAELAAIKPQVKRSIPSNEIESLREQLSTITMQRDDLMAVLIAVALYSSQLPTYIDDVIHAVIAKVKANMQ